MKELFNPDKADLIRETIIIVFGLIARWIELRKFKKKKKESDDQF
jgi:hypothetical protein